MMHVLAIASRELRSYFVSPVAYVVLMWLETGRGDATTLGRL